MSKRLASHIVRTFTGPMWHGPALGEVLDGLTPEQAAARPAPGAHSIWEIVLHLATWAEVALARLEGSGREYPSPEEDWPSVAEATDEAWTAAVRRLELGYRTLAAAVEDLEEGRLFATLPSRDHTVRDMLHGVIEHGAYHGGQIALLRRALAGVPA